MVSITKGKNDDLKYELNKMFNNLTISKSIPTHADLRQYMLLEKNHR